MDVTVQYLDGVRFELEARGHRVICDQPPDNAGGDTGMSPPEFLLASLGSCAAFYALQYLRARSLDARGLKVSVHAEKSSQPARLSCFRIEVETAEVEERHKEGVLRAVKACLIHNTLLNTPAIETVLRTPAAATP
jgi:uncharacterized OsmC-like protein